MTNVVLGPMRVSTNAGSVTMDSNAWVTRNAVPDANLLHIEHVLSCDICTKRQADEKKLRKSRKKWKERAKAASRVARRLEEIVQEDARRFATIASVKPS